MKIKKGTWLVVLMVVAMLFALLPAVGGAEVGVRDHIPWTGQGTDSINCEEYEQGTMHWVLTGAEDVTDPVLMLHDKDGKLLETNDEPIMTGPVYHFYTGYYDLDNLDAKVRFDGTLAMNRQAKITSQFVLSGYCPGEVTCVPARIIYGVTGYKGTGGLYQIEITEGEIKETLLKSISGITGATDFYANGLASDDENNRLYFAIRKSGSTSTDLYFWDFVDEPVLAATGLTGDVYGATWGNGKYWYIANGSNTMRTVTFDAAGINGTVEIFEANFAGVKSFNFGDMALDAEENVIYVSTSFSGTNKEFFKYDLNNAPGARYSFITAVAADKAIGLQLGFGENGVLYGHSTFVNALSGSTAREWFAVNKVGTAVSLGNGLHGYNDLASGPSVCVD